MFSPPPHSTGFFFVRAFLPFHFLKAGKVCGVDLKKIGGEEVFVLSWWLLECFSLLVEEGSENTTLDPVWKKANQVTEANAERKGERS